MLSGMVLGLDIGGTQIKAASVDEAGAIVRSQKSATPSDLARFETALRELIGALMDGSPVRGVGVGCKGLIDPETTRIVYEPGVLRYLEGCVLSDLVCRAAGKPVAVYADNDARVALVGECVWGAARGLRNALMFTLGTGVGGGILSDGHIVRGHGGAAGHLGHVTVEVDGPPCICGNRGCLESVFSARAIEAIAFSAVHRGLPANFPGGAQNPPSCADVFAAAAQGDETARWIVESGVRKLAAAMAGLMHALDPEVVIIGGQVAAAGETLFAPLRREVAWRTAGLLRRQVPIVPMQVADSSGVVGAAALVYEAGRELPPQIARQ
jgi:glucokinase